MGGHQRGVTGGCWVDKGLGGIQGAFMGARQTLRGCFWRAWQGRRHWVGVGVSATPSKGQRRYPGVAALGMEGSRLL